MSPASWSCNVRPVNTWQDNSKFHFHLIEGHQFHVLLGQTSQQHYISPGHFIGIKLHQITKTAMMNQKLDFMHTGHIDIKLMEIS